MCAGQLGGELAVVQPEASARDTQPAGAEPLSEMRDRSRPERDIDGGVQLEDPLALGLGVTAAHGDHAVGPLALACGCLAQVSGELRVRLLADRAGVEDDHVRLVGGRRLAEPELLEHPLDPLRVMGVHLASEGRDEVPAHRHRVAVPPVGQALQGPTGAAV